MKLVGLSEAAVQRQIRQYLAALAIDAVHAPNGAVLAGDKVARAKQSAALKRAGVMPGFPDLILFDRKVRRCGFMEVKSATGRVTPAQQQFAADYATVWGWPYAVVRSVEDAAETLAKWGWR